MSRIFIFKLAIFGLSFFLSISVFSQRVKGKVYDANSGQPLLGVSVLVEGEGLGMNTSLSGSYSLRLKPGSYRLRASIVGYQTTVVPFRIGTSDLLLDIPLQNSASALDEVVVVGSRSTTARSSTETTAPIDAFTVEDLAATGQVDPAQMLNYVAPSFNSARQTVADGTDHVDPATLRGLGPDQVLVLMNGKRRHTSALVNVNGTIGRGSVGTDLNAIPTAAIERIEVLRDGAAAQYGSDAIAGIVNVVLRKETGRTYMNAHAGRTYADDGGTLQYGLYRGFKIGKGYLTIAGDLRYRQPTNRVGTYTAFVYRDANTGGLPTAENQKLDEALIQQRGFSRENNMLVGNSEMGNAGVVVNAGVPLSKSAEFYATGSYNYRQGTAAGFYRYPRQTTQVDLSIYPDGFLPKIQSTINDRSFLAGIQGVTGNNWRYDLSNTFGGNSFRFDVKNSLNASLGAQSPTEFYCGTIKFDQNTANFGLSKNFGEQIGLTSFNFALGGEYRYDRYQILAGDEASYINGNATNARTPKAAGAQVFPGFQLANEVNATRSVTAAYADLETDLTDWLLVSGAVRYENYSDFGQNIASKAAARIKFADWLSLRGSYSTGFRAPSMHQRYFNAISTVFVTTPQGLAPLQQGTFRNGGDVANAFGIPSLTAETSTNISFGITSRPVSNLSITADVYQMEIQNRIVLTGSFPKSNATVAKLLAALPDVNSAIFFTNAISTQTRGLDIIMSYNAKLGKNSLDLTLAGNFNETKIIGDVKTTDQLPAADFSNTLFNLEERGRIEQGQPRSKIMASAHYKIGLVGLQVRATRFGEVAAIFNGGDRSRDEFFSSKFITDASLSVRALKALTLTIGGNNLFDIYPDKIQNLLNSSDGRFIYSRNVTQFGFNGGYYYANLALNF